MTIKPVQYIVNRKSGSILIELNILFLVIVLAGVLYSPSAKMVFTNYKRILADLEIAQAARYTESILRRELSYNTTLVRLSKDFAGKDQLVCQKTFKNVRNYWYISNSILYRRTIKENSTGINPFSNPEIQIIDFRTQRLSDNKIGILITFKHSETGLIRKLPLTLILSNGYVTE